VMIDNQHDAEHPQCIWPQISRKLVA